MLLAVEPIDSAIFARRALRAENLDTEMAGELARRGDDALEELLVAGLVTSSDAAGHGCCDGTARRLLGGQFISASLNCNSPIEFPCGSMSQAARAKPTSATPSTVFSPGPSYSSSSTPRERRSATSAARSLTRQEALGWDSLVPAVLRVTTRRLSPPQRKVRKSSLSSRTSSPTL